MSGKDFIFELPMQVRDYELDSQGIVNNAVYLHYLEYTRHEFCRMVGCSFRDLQLEGIDPVLRKVEIEYVRSLVSGDRFVSKLAFWREGPRFIFRQHLFTPGGDPVVRADVTVVCLRGGRLTRGDELAAPFAKYL